MQNRPTSASGRKWQRYNRWRAANRELDRIRRLERIAAKKAIAVENQPMPRCSVPRLAKALARVRIYFSDGTSAGFSIRQTPFGPSISPTLAGHKITALLANR